VGHLSKTIYPGGGATVVTLTNSESNEIIGSCFSDEGSLYCTPHHPTSKRYANYDFSLDETVLDR